MLCAYTAAYAQDDEEDERKPDDTPTATGKVVIPTFDKSITGGFKLPNALANNSFKKVFNGVSNLEVSYRQPFLKNFFIGAGLQHSYYDINRFSFPEVSVGNMQSFLGVGEIGYQKYITENWYYLLSARAGYGLVRVTSDNCKAMGLDMPQQGIFFTEAMAGIYLRGNDRMSYGLVVSHQIHYFDFGPEWVCRSSFSGLTPGDYTGLTQSLTVGFGFVCILGKML